MRKFPSLISENWLRTYCEDVFLGYIWVIQLFEHFSITESNQTAYVHTQFYKLELWSFWTDSMFFFYHSYTLSNLTLILCFKILRIIHFCLNSFQGFHQASSTVDMLIEQGEMKLADSLTELALSFFTEVVTLFPMVVEAYELRAQCYFKLVNIFLWHLFVHRLDWGCSS